MIVLELPFYADIPAFDYQITLDGEQYTLTFRWNGERQGWYLSMETALGATVYRNRRLTPGADLGRSTSALAPPGILTCVAPDDPYARDELVVVYVPADQLSELQPPRADVFVAIGTPPEGAPPPPPPPSQPYLPPVDLS